MIHYHGTPITPRATLLQLAGRHFCVRYGAHGDEVVAHEIGQSVMLDNGAYSRWTKNEPTDWPGYYAWCERWLEHWTTWAVIPDVVEGGEAENDALLGEWPFGTRGAPVWHVHESLARLRRLCEAWPLVCLGSSGEYAVVGAPRWHARMAEAMAAVCDNRGVPITRLHMLRGLRFAGGDYPFFSADSTNIARNHEQRQDVVRMATDIDGKQAPPRWRAHAPHPTLELKEA